MEPLGGAERAGGLGGALLGLAELGDRLGERGQTGDQHDRPERRVAGEVPVGRQQPGGPPQAIAGRGGRGDTAVGGAGGAVVRVSGLAEDPAAQRGGGRVQGVGRRPRPRPRPTAGSVRGERPDLRGRPVGGPGGVLPDRASLGRGERVIAGLPGALQRWRSLGKVRSAASLPPPYQTGPPALVVSPGSATAYPVTWPGLRALLRVRTSTPDRPSRAKNSCSLAAAAAAVLT